MDIRSISICSGIGGLDLGLRIGSRRRIRTVCYVEREAYAAATLVARMEDSTLDRAPVWDDLTTFDGRPWRGRVDLLFGGIPCQPYSCAGKGLGKNDERDLWNDARRILRETGARLFFLENVAAFVNRGMPRVLRELAEDGFNAVWGVLSCGQLGAPHRRERLFLLGYSQDTQRWCREFSGKGEEGLGRGRPYGSSPGLADSGCIDLRFQPGRKQGEGWPDTRQPRDFSERLERFWPGGQDPGEWRDVPRRLWPAIPKPVLRGVAHGLPSWVGFASVDRTSRLRAMGNAVSPPVAAVAWRELWERARIDAAS